MAAAQSHAAGLDDLDDLEEIEEADQSMPSGEIMIQNPGNRKQSTT